MKFWLITAAVGVAIVLAGCSSQDAPRQVAASHAGTSGATELDPSTWVSVMPAVREYFYYRKKAILSGDSQVLWNRYPDPETGCRPEDRCQY